MGAKGSTVARGSSSGPTTDIESRGALISRIHVLERAIHDTGDIIRFRYFKPNKSQMYNTVIVFQGGKRHRSSEFYDDRDFMFYTIFQCLECWTAMPRTNSRGSKDLLDGAPKRGIVRGNSGFLMKTASGSPRKDGSPRADTECSPRTDSSPRLIKVNSQVDLLREIRPARAHARLMESRIAIREYVSDANYESVNKDEIVAMVKRLVADLVISGDVPAFIMKITAYDTGLVPASNFPYYLNFRSNVHSSLSAQLMFHLQWYRSVLSVSPVLDIRLSIVDLIGTRVYVNPDSGSPYTPLDMRPEDTNTPSWHHNGLLNLHPTLLQDLFTFETVLMCLPAASRSELVFPKGTVLCKDTSQNLEKILAENPVLKSRVKTTKQVV